MAKKEHKTWTHRVKLGKGQVPIIAYAAREVPILGSKSAVKKAIAGTRLFVNGKKANFSTTVKKGDVLELHGAGVSKVQKFDFDLDIVFEDDYLMLVNKPGGIAVNGNRQKTVENALQQANQANSLPDALPHPVAVHRIDVPTRGLVLLAKTKTALIQLSKAFQKNQVKKEYAAIVHGIPPKEGTIDQALEGKAAVTHFKTIRAVPSRVFGHLALLKLQPETGRTHQLRLHLKNQGYLIVGDKMYAGDTKTILGKGLMLCACQLQFEHPVNQKVLNIEIEVPTKFKKLLDREEKRY